MKQKYIKWIGTINLILATILGGISVYEKLIKEKQLTKILIASIILFLSLSLICFLVLWKTSEKEKQSLKKILQEKENENRALKKEMCQTCKKIYAYAYDESLSLNEDFGKCFSLINEISDKEGEVYSLDEYIFVDFSIKGEGKECYLINLIDGLIYLPVDEWKTSKGDELLIYRQLCSNRKIHLDFSQLL